jgi:hypothetical protein
LLLKQPQHAQRVIQLRLGTASALCRLLGEIHESYDQLEERLDKSGGEGG